MMSRAEEINRFKLAYSEDKIEECNTALFFLMLSYNSEIREGKSYDHDLKHILFKSNCIHNPIGMKYSKKDYEKIMKILLGTIELARNVNNPQSNISNLIQKGIKIEKQIIADLLDIVAYTECFYKMNAVNTERMDSCEAGKVPFAEQLLSLILFHQDQNRLVIENCREYMNTDYRTGMELSVPRKPVTHYKNVKNSISDHFETFLEDINQIVNYLYYQFGRSFPERIEIADLQVEQIHPYENEKFEQYLYIALQRAMLCRLEEGIRYGYYELREMKKTEEGILTFAFGIENDEKYKARRMGVLRRECQVRQQVLMDLRNQKDNVAGNKKVAVLSEKFLKVQKKGSVLLDFSDFCPDKAVFLEAEKIANIKERIVESLTKEYYLDCKVKEIEVRDMILTYKFLRTISEILYVASKKCIDEENQETLLQEISLVEIEYFSKELARIHDFDLDYAKKLIDRFIFHEKNNREDDIFAQPLLKVSRTQVVISQALMDQVNLDRVIERQFIRYKQDVSAVGVAFEEKFLRRLTQGYQQGIADLKLKEVPNFQVNTNKVKYEAFDGKEIEFDVVSVLGDHLVLTELKAIMTSYDLNDLEERKKNIKKAVEQLQRRKESVKYDWDKFKNALSIEVPDEPYDEEHIILVACTDSYDYTPLKKEDVFITDDSSYLKYFTNPYVDILITQQGKVEIKNVKTLWKHGKPKANEFKEYLMNPVSISPFTNTLKKEWIPLPVMDEKDYGIFLEEYVLMDDPIANAAKNVKKEGKATKKKKKIYPNDPCPCNSGKKYKYCCGK